MVVSLNLLVFEKRNPGFIVDNEIDGTNPEQ